MSAPLKGAWSKGAPAPGNPSSTNNNRSSTSEQFDFSSMPSLPGNPPPPSPLAQAQAASSAPNSLPDQRRSNVQRAQQQPLVDAYIVLDFEATCEKDTKLPAQEIIEFPMVVVDPVTKSIVSEFQRYVRPVHCPKLTTFCTELTGITQEVVDRAQTFPTVAEEALSWLAAGNFGERAPARSFLFVTCGDWDLKTMLPHQLSHTKPLRHPFPASLFSQWVNLKTFFQQVNPKVRCTGMPGLLSHYGLQLAGRHHSGIDDCRNIAQVLIEMLKAGHVPCAPTATVASSRGKGGASSDQVAPSFLPWNGTPAPWPPTTIVAASDCPPPSAFNENVVAYQKPRGKEPPVAANPSQILPNPKDFPIEYILATEAPPKFNNPQEVTAMSKRLAWALRHNAVAIGLNIDSRGFVAMDELCANKEFRNKANLAGLATIAKIDGKGRYRIEYREADGRFYMGATQGHSMDGIDADLKPITNPQDVPVAVHGTTSHAWNSIKTSGLSVMTRQHVHFATGLPSDSGVISGMRNSSAVLVYLDVAKVLNDGIPLFRSQNGVILCPGVGTTGIIPPQYFVKVEDAVTRRPLQ